MADLEAVTQKILRLKSVRRALGWSEEHCAHQLGVTYSTLSRWERGESLPKSLLVLRAIDRFVAEHERAALQLEQNTGHGI